MVYFTVLYVVVTIIVGLLAARLVKNTEDYLLAGLIVATLEIFSIISPGEIFAGAPDNFFRFHPEPGAVNSLNYLAAWITIGLGSIAAIFCGMLAWLMASFIETLVAPIIYGLAASSLGMILGSLSEEEKL